MMKRYPLALLALILLTATIGIATHQRVDAVDSLTTDGTSTFSPNTANPSSLPPYPESDSSGTQRVQ
jgi:hypothetical protein